MWSRHTHSKSVEGVYKGNTLIKSNHEVKYIYDPIWYGFNIKIVCIECFKYIDFPSSITLTRSI